MAGRPPSTKTTETKQDAVENNNQTESTQDNKILQENTELKKQLQEMQEMMKQLMENQKASQLTSENSKSIINKTETNEENGYEDYPEIPTNKPIRVMSLFNGGLNLKTSNDSSAQVFRFEKIGSIQPIMYMDLSRVLSNQRSFFEEGYCIIMDKDVIKIHYLEDYMKKILDYKTIINILDYDIETVKTLVSNVTKTIQETIIDLLIEKINNNENFDRNKITEIGNIFGHDIYELAGKVK